MHHPKIGEELLYEKVKLGQFRQCVDVCTQFCHFVDVYVGKRHGERYLKIEGVYERDDIHHPNQIGQYEFFL
jgi:hypothetical protein